MKNSLRLVSDYAKWLGGVTKDLRLKKPKLPESGNYAYELVPPTIYEMVCPPKNIASGSTAPSITVKINAGTLHKSEAVVTVRFEIETWNPGRHLQDYMIANNVESGAGSVRSKATKPQKPTFEKNMDGWKDGLVLLETIVGRLDADEQAAGYLRRGEIKYSFPFEKEAFVSSYPYQYMTVDFDVWFESYHHNPIVAKMLE